MKQLFIVFVSMFLLTFPTDYAWSNADRSPCSLVLSPDGNRLYVAEHTSKQITVWDCQTQSIAQTYPLEQNPNGLALTPDGDILCVTIGSDQGELLMLAAHTGQELGRVETGHTPMSPIVLDNGSVIGLCNRFSGAVQCYEWPGLKRIMNQTAGREPIALAVTPDQTVLWVANHLPDGPANVDYASAKVQWIQREAPGRGSRPQQTIELPNGSTGVRGLCIEPEGHYAYVTHILAHHQLPTTRLDQGWMNTNALSILDLQTKQWLCTVLLDNACQGAANPWAISCTSDGNQLVVSHAGTQELSIIDRKALHTRLDQTINPKPIRGEKTEKRQAPLELAYDLTFLTSLRARVPLLGNGPRDLCIAKNKIYVAEYFTDSIGIVDLNKAVTLDSIALGNHQTMSPKRLGEMLFNDASFCYQTWQSCATCHPDVRTDGLNWDLLNDGMGNSKNTRSLLKSHETPPVMITGIRPNAETAVRAGLMFIQFSIRPETHAEAIDTYLYAHQSLVSPYRVKGQLSEAALRGQKLFQSSGCMACHSGPNFTNLQSYDVGTGNGPEAGQRFDTPTLVEVWRTAPYLYDGRARTMVEVLRDFNPEDRHGYTSHLSEAEIQDLAIYILSL